MESRSRADGFSFMFFIQNLIKGTDNRISAISLALENDHFFTIFTSCLTSSSVSLEMVYGVEIPNFSTPVSVMEH